MEHKGNIYFAKLQSEAILPKRATEDSAGFDLFCLEDTLIVGGAGNFLVPTGIAVKLPPGTYGRIAMRSGLALKQHLTVSAGVIDRDYTGPIGVLVSSTKIFDVRYVEEKEQDDFIRQLTLTSSSDNNDNSSLVKTQTLIKINPVLTPHYYLIRKGERFAQLIVENVSYAPSEELLFITDNEEKHGGFGSTGMN